MTAKPAPIKFCISMCSRRRPVLLRRALDSLAELVVPENVTLSFLVVENDDSPQYADIIAAFEKRMKITYAVESVAGLTPARNKVLSELNKMDIDWMGGVDDDLIVDRNWLVHMVAGIRAYPDTRMFTGNWQRFDPDTTAYWHPRLNMSQSRKTGRKMPESAGGNLAMHRSVFSPDGMGLRYDPYFRFLGGEDTDFSLQYTGKGGIIRHIDEARTVEELHQERATLQNRLHRVIAVEYLLAKLRHKHQSSVVALLWSIQIVYRSAIFGIGNMFLAGIALPFRERWAMVRYGESLRFFWKVRGVIRYYFGDSVERYRETVGK